MDSKKRMQLRLELSKPSEFTKESESNIVNLLRKTRSPFSGTPESADQEGKVEAEALALENSLRSFQKELVQQERTLREKELRIAETEAAMIRRATELSDARRMLDKQREVFESGLRAASDGSGEAHMVNEDSLRVMKELQSKIDEQTRAIEESKEWLHERETFLEESEKILFEKMQRHQERESEMDQQAENLRNLEKKLAALTEKLRAKGEQI
jgi:hypothetical protein